MGMCGGFACAVGRDPRGGGATIARHLLYNTGRLSTYCFMGVLAGMLGQIICTPQGINRCRAIPSISVSAFSPSPPGFS